MKQLIPFLLMSWLVAGTSTVLAQTAPGSGAPAPPCAAYTGRVAANEKPLAGVSVAVKGTNIILITNQEGFFALPPKVTQLPTLSVSAAGYAPQEVKLTSCIPVVVEMQILPGTRIKKHGKRKGFIMSAGY
ncbi:hypothetical protein A0257_13395 [Hymenobacter psoromatis]|nr:hypothetical protein A0257_13395 [Hymenobacter psoromatis]